MPSRSYQQPASHVTADDFVDRLRDELEAIWPALRDLANGVQPDNGTRLRAGIAERRITKLLDAYGCYR